MKWIILIIIILSVSCRTNQNAVSIIRQKDSVILVEKIIIDTMYIPASNVTATLPVANIKDTVIIRHSKGQATAKLIIKDGKINCEAYCDSLWKIYQKNTTNTYQQKINSDERKQTYLTRPCNKWFWFVLGFLSAFISIIVLSIIIQKFI